MSAPRVLRGTSCEAALVPLTPLDGTTFCVSRPSAICTFLRGAACFPACRSSRQRWSGTWCLTASHAGSALDDSASVPAAVFCLFVGISPRIQIGHACPSSLPPPPCQKLSKVEFCKVRLAHSHHQHDCVCSRRLYTYLEEEEDSGGFGLFTPTETFFVFKLWGRRLPELTLQFQFHPETALPVSQWVRGGIRPAACQATASNYLSFTHPTFLS